MTTSRRLKIAARAALALYMAALALLCFCHSPESMELKPELFGIPTDKIAHFLMFLPFPPLCLLSFYRHGGKPQKAIMFVLWTLVAGFLIAAGTEIFQSTLSYRTGDYLDFRADCIGLMVSGAASLAFTFMRKSS